MSASDLHLMTREAPKNGVASVCGDGTARIAFGGTTGALAWRCVR